MVSNETSYPPESSINNAFIDPYKGYTVPFLYNKLLETIDSECVDSLGCGYGIRLWLTNFCFSEQHHLVKNNPKEWKLIGPTIDEQSLPIRQKLQTVISRFPQGISAKIESTYSRDFRDDITYPGNTYQRNARFYLNVDVSDQYSKLRFASLCEGSIIHDHCGTTHFRCAASNFYYVLKEHHMPMIHAIVSRLQAVDWQNFQKRDYDDVTKITVFAVFPTLVFLADEKVAAELKQIPFQEYSLGRTLTIAEQYAVAQLLAEVIAQSEQQKYQYQLEIASTSRFVLVRRFIPKKENN